MQNESLCNQSHTKKKVLKGKYCALYTNKDQLGLKVIQKRSVLKGKYCVIYTNKDKPCLKIDPCFSLRGN